MFGCVRRPEVMIVVRWQERSATVVYGPAAVGGIPRENWDSSTNATLYYLRITIINAILQYDRLQRISGYRVLL